MTYPRLRSTLALAAAALLFAGCRYTVNLITERRGFDRYQDMARQAQKRIADNQAFLNEVLAATEDEDLEPYPQLGEQIEAMKQAMRQEAEDQARIEAFKRRYDEFAAGRSQISSDDADDWNRFKALQGDFNAIAVAVNGDFAQFNQAGQNFVNLLNQYHVERISAADLGKEIDEFNGRMADALKDMGERVGAPGTPSTSRATRASTPRPCTARKSSWARCATACSPCA